MLQGVFYRIVIYAILIFNIGIVCSQPSSPPTLASQISQLAELDDWHNISVRGHQLLSHPDISPELRFELLKSLAREAFKRDNFAATERYLKEIEAEHEAEPFSESYYFATKLLAINAFHQSRYTVAIELYLKALNIAIKRKQPLEQAHMHNNLGLAYVETNELSRATSHYGEAQKIYQKHGNLQDEADIMLNLSALYIRQYQFDTAQEMLDIAINYFKQLNDDYGIALANTYLGELYSKKGLNLSARHYYQAAIEYYEAENNTDQLIAQYAYLANVSIAQGNFEQAQREANFSLYYAEKINSKSGRMLGLFPLAKTLFAKGDIETALNMIEESLQLSTQFGSRYLEREELATLALIQASAGKHEDALINFTRYKNKQSEYLNENVLTKMVEYQNRIEAVELNREITELKQNQALQALQIDKREQVIWLSAMVVLSLLIAVVSLYYKQAEKNAKVELREKVAERTIELQRVADELRKANQVKNQFLANISHEIRTPLTSIIGQAEAMLNDHASNPELKVSLGVIQRQGEHLKALVSDVLDLSRIEAQRLELEYTEFSAKSLLDDISDMFYNACKVKGLDFSVKGDFDDSIMVRLDYMRLKQVLINLLGNAVKFTEQGKVGLHVSCHSSGLVFKVFDTGIGMSQEQLGRVFESFQQGDNSITRRFGGSGLGLCLSQQLTEMMDGSISVNSQLHKGSEFIVFIPCSPEHSELPSSEEQPQAVHWEYGKVLVAEDHDDNRALFQRVLEQLGLQVLAAKNGEEAVEMCLREYPDIVLMDIQMPKMDGVEALNLLHLSGFDQPVYALTANVMEHEIKAYLKSGFTGHLGKPLDRKMLIKVLQRHLSKVSEAPVMQLDMSDLALSFVATLASERASIIEFWQAQEWCYLQRACHRLSGAASTFNFVSLANTARQLENMLKTQEYKQAENLYLILCDELQYTCLSEQLDVG
ncbi:response regulator [Pseudoalteromonas sp. JBTF-M23]|uniref:histidine kinase n=1 Tax=Pseudoalteromonas caenipelagi TaxID=2726988 RepID=A0A849VJI6_9GAMM|nr:ATP-binding protein [Pseudoalteromonas caenipelagi]NOU52970.1 response regulator [Pseudoalteromonas caenipelagi]